MPLPDNTAMFILVCVACGIMGYLLGSANFAIIITHLFFKEDIRKMGSGNAGMTNVLRSFGKKGAVLTLLGDIGKGALSALLGRLIFWIIFPETSYVYGAFIAGICAVVGHLFPLYFKFKGGKGVAVSGGVILGIQPLVALPLIIVFLLIIAITGMVSLASVIGMGLYPFVMYFYAVWANMPQVFCTVCAGIITGLVIIVHRANLRRIIKGEEYRFGKRFKKSEELPTDAKT